MDIKSKLQNCTILSPEDPKAEYLFYQVPEATVLDHKGKVTFKGTLMVANLDGYAVIPVKKYEELKDKAWRYDGLCK